MRRLHGVVPLLFVAATVGFLASFTHAIEGFLSVPEYGGNENTVGWQEISFPGDTQPRGYAADQVTRSDGLDPVVPDALLFGVLENIDQAALGIVARRRGGS